MQNKENITSTCFPYSVYCFFGGFDVKYIYAFNLPYVKEVYNEMTSISETPEDYGVIYKPDHPVVIIKKDGTKESFNVQKVITAIGKSAYRALTDFTPEEKHRICQNVVDRVNEFGKKQVPISLMHNIVEESLEEIKPIVAKSYRDYRNYKQDFVRMMDDVYKKSQSIMYIGDKENSNTDSALVATKRSLTLNQLNKELYQKFFMTTEELQACREGYIYVHDMSARRDTMNCCLFDVRTVLTGGFEMGNVWYNEPKTLDTAFDVIGDVTLSAASQQYGGFTLPEIDTVLEPYAQKSYDMYYEKYLSVGATKEVAAQTAWDDVVRDMEQGFQGWEYKFNTVGSSRGDYPFITISLGLGTGRFAKLASICALNVRRKGQGKKGNKKPVLFPKIVFLYDENLHGEGKPLEDVFDTGIACSMKTMYPDWLSLTGEGYVPSIYKKYGRVISPMGCRAFLSPWYEKGGPEPADENDKPVFVGRFNIGAVSLHLPMILAKSRQEGRDFYEVLDHYLNMIRNLHIRTYAYLGEMRASTNPLGYCEGGFYGGHLGLHDKIKPVLKAMTASFGVTALNELQQLYNGKSIVQDGEFALEVMRHINDKINEFKKEDGNLYAIYGTPAENLCFSGATVIQTYGGHKQIKDLTTDDLVYSFNSDEHKIELKKVVYAARTGIGRQVVKVTMDNGQEIICTPEHPFAVRRMSQDNKTGQITGKETVEYVKAKDLKAGNRIKSNYIKLNETTGRLECSIYHNGAKQLVQDINAEYVYGPKPEGYVTHHKDEDKLNNLFNNLEYKTDADHRRHHMPETIGPNCYTSEDQSGEKNSFYGKHHTKEANERNRTAHIGKSIECLSIDGRHVRSFECADDAEKAGFTRHAVVQACKGKGRTSVHRSGHGYKKMLWFYTDECKQLALEANHKVASVEYLDEPMDVYDIQVEDNHNFFVGGDDGILVHNCGVQIKQFRAMYGIVEGVSDREYVSNSFHCHVTEDITPIQKQDLEYRFWNFFNGGKIQYVKYPIDYNVDAVKTLVRRAMDMGLYEGVNMSLAYCDDCGHQELEMDVCPKCGSRNLTKIDRMNGYLSYSRVHGDTRLNAAKMAEIAERKSM